MVNARVVTGVVSVFWALWLTTNKVLMDKGGMPPSELVGLVAATSFKKKRKKERNYWPAGVSKRN